MNQNKELDGVLDANGNVDIMAVAAFMVDKEHNVSLNNSKLIEKAIAVAGNMSYSDKDGGAAKRIINELCHRLGSRTVTLTKKKDGWLMRDLYGDSRFLSFKEAILWRLFKVLPDGKVLSE